MSYILDALKKAERDRGIAKAPSLMAVHELRPAGGARRWAVAGMLLLCAGAVVLIATMLRTRSRTGGAPGAASVAAQPQTPVPQTVQNEPTAAVRVERSIPETANAPAAQSASRAVRPSAEPAPAPHLQPAENPVRPPQSREDTAVAAATQPPVPAAVSTQGETAAAPVAAPGAHPASLREAVAGMNMTVLVYADARAERLVFINGRRYVEGDYVADVYLLESIRPDGAVLSYGAERAVLRPPSAH